MHIRDLRGRGKEQIRGDLWVAMSALLYRINVSLGVCLLIGICFMVTIIAAHQLSDMALASAF